MSDARTKALEAVAEAARAWCEAPAGNRRTAEKYAELCAAVAALDALPAEPAQEVVEAEIWEDKTDGELRLRRAHHIPPDWATFAWTLAGTTVLPIRRGGGA